MNTQFASNVHEFTENLFKAMLEEFDGTEVGSEEFNLEKLMDFHFPDYKPGAKVKKAKKVVDPNKPKRALSGYTFFGRENKGMINEEIAKHGDDGRPKFVEVQSKLWKALSDGEKEEWKEKAAAAK